MELKEAILQTLAEMDTNLKKPLKEMKLEREVEKTIYPDSEETKPSLGSLNPPRWK